MKVTLIDWTGKGAMHLKKSSPDVWGEDNYGEYAVDLLLFTKETRLQMSPSALEEIKSRPYHVKFEQLEYMANTIPSSWEFIDYTFMIEGVSRGFTHQFVRSRQFSFAQQTMRVLDVSEGIGWNYLIPPNIASIEEINRGGVSEKKMNKSLDYHRTMGEIANAYKSMIAAGVPIEDARGILPTNILTNIVGKCNMRTFVELVHKRSSLRVQGEYRDVLAAMKAEVLKVHPWMALFIDRTADRAADELQEEISKISAVDNGKSLAEAKAKMIKLLDQIRKVM